MRVPYPVLYLLFLILSVSLLGRRAFKRNVAWEKWNPPLSNELRWKSTGGKKGLTVRPYDLKHGGTLMLLGTSVIDQEPHVVDLLTQLDCSNGPLVVDVGANDGFISLVAATYGCETIGFEIQDTCLELAHAVQRLNGIDNPTSFVQRPVSNVADDVIALNMSPLCHGGFSVRNKGSERQFKTITLDIALGHTGKRIALLKIDIEGTEPLVLEGSRQLFQRGLVDAVIMESTWWTTMGPNLRDAFHRVAFVYEYGYNIMCLAGYQEPQLRGVLYDNRDEWMAASAKLQNKLTSGHVYVRCTEMFICKRDGCPFQRPTRLD